MLIRFTLISYCCFFFAMAQDNTPKENDLVYFVKGSPFQLNPENCVAFVSKVTKYDNYTLVRRMTQKF